MQQLPPEIEAKQKEMFCHLQYIFVQQVKG